jgi:ABC-type multidrug transport system fused ATPase/permease subunit
MTSTERLIQFQDIVPEAPYRIEATKPASNWPTEGNIIFDNLQLRYRPELPLVLKGVNCVIKPREKIGIVGRTGSGKIKTIN